MTVGVLIITHENFGEAVLKNTLHILGMCPLNTKTLSIPFNADPDEMLNESRELVQSLDEGDGVLVLTDLYGATPSNIAHRLVQLEPVKIITGVNMPMMMRIMNYPSLTIDQLVEKAVDGGQEGVFINRRL
jgi:PTS system ascorbate-specific IIA component